MALSKNLRRKWISHVKFTFYLLLGIGLFSTFMYFIGTNWEKPNLNPAKPTASESARQELAIDSARIAAGAKKLGLTELSTLADTWTNDLGGVWAPWPEGAPAGYKNPGLDLSAKSATVPELVAELTLFAQTLADKGTAFAPPPAMIDFASKVFIQADQLARMHSLPQALPEVALPQVASLINDAQTVVELESTKQILEAHTALLPPGRKQSERKIGSILHCLAPASISRLARVLMTNAALLLLQILIFRKPNNCFSIHYPHSRRKMTLCQKQNQIQKMPGNSLRMQC
ncbi:hypothetical protein [Arcanobacterium hippocoleae]|uniref:hypothetical protein n=1 Tax=Arcanobacterium hippocoleae TaxID=149017 RepID=UPI00333FB7D5